MARTFTRDEVRHTVRALQGRSDFFAVIKDNPVGVTLMLGVFIFVKERVVVIHARDNDAHAIIPIRMMSRRTFLSTVAALGVSLNLPDLPLLISEDSDVDCGDGTFLTLKNYVDAPAAILGIANTEPAASFSLVQMSLVRPDKVTILHYAFSAQHHFSWTTQSPEAEILAISGRLTLNTTPIHSMMIHYRSLGHA